MTTTTQAAGATNILQGVGAPIETMTTNELSAIERKQLGNLERRIEANLEDTAKALYEINKDRLYRESGTFEDYLSKRWQMARSEGYRYVTAGKVLDLVKEAAPLAMSAIIELSKFDDPKEAAEVVKALGGKPTAEQVKVEREKRKPTTERPAPQVKTGFSVRITVPKAKGAELHAHLKVLHDKTALKNTSGDKAILSHDFEDDGETAKFMQGVCAQWTGDMAEFSIVVVKN